MPKKKALTRRKPAGKKSRKKSTVSRKRGRFSGLRKLLVIIVLSSLVLFTFYVGYLANQVAIKFEGKRWAVPARVYGRALEIYPGSPVSEQEFKAELRRLGYQKQKSPMAPGTWGFSNHRYLVNTRAFGFWDEQVPAESLVIVFKDQKLQSIRNRNTGKEKDLLRLEAPMIESIYPSHNEDRILLKRSDIPPLLVKALVAVEDRDFYQHWGVNPKSILRALLANIRAGHVVQGGSTLTQQLVKNFLLSSERTLLRKINEALMSLIVEWQYSKDDILEAYANEIYLGQDARRAIHGFGLASRFYFNRPLQELDVSRIALLVGMIKGPSWYSPNAHPQRALKRRNLVLDLMHEQKILTSKQVHTAKNRGLGVARKGWGGQRSYPAFISLVRRQLHRDYREQDLTSEGLRIFTTLDPWVQEQAESAVKITLANLEKKHHLKRNSLQTAVVIANPQNGEIQALLGGRKSGYSGFNRALDAVRPVGSLIKPVVYLAALMEPDKYTLVTPVRDKKISLKFPNGDVWKPDNFDHKQHGNVSLITALAKSYNLATVRLGLDVGLQRVLSVLRKTGIERPVNTYPSLLLGAVALSPLEVTQIYQTLSAGGFRSPLRAINEVMDSQNRPLQRYPLTVDQTLPAAPVYLLDRALQTVVNAGTAKALQWKLPKNLQLAGKTGTTDDLRDSWFAGFSQDRVATVWVGRDDNKSAGLTGSQGAMEVWAKMMKPLDLQPLRLFRPDTVITEWIDMNNGLRANEKCEQAVEMEFIKGSEPRVASSCIENSKSFFERLFSLAY